MNDLTSSTYLNDLIVKTLPFFKTELQLNIFSTTCQLFHRYYKKSTSSYDPFIICASCLYLACKIEDVPIKVDKLMDMFDLKNRQDIQKSIVSSELHVLETVNFDIKFYSPFLALDGLLLELKNYRCFTENFNHDPQYTKCIEYIKRALLLFKVVSNFSVSQISMASVLSVYGLNTLRAKICPDRSEFVESKLNSILEIINKHDFTAKINYQIPIFEISTENVEEIN